MPGPAVDRTRNTVVDFFDRLNHEGIEYALLRNFEQYPAFTHDIDLVIRWTDLPRWRAVAEACAAAHAWDALTECDHWARSPARAHTIQVLRFYKHSPLQYLQIDAFHSLLLFAFPLFDEDMLLRNRVWDERGFYRIDARIENLFRLLQISKLSGGRGNWEKQERYRQRALNFWGEGAELSAFASRLDLAGLSTAFNILKMGNYSAFQKSVNRAKLSWWLRRMTGNPWSGCGMLLHRAQDYLRNFLLRPCGFKVSVYADGEEQRRRLESILRQLRDSNLLLAYTFSSQPAERRRVLERGGLIVEWQSSRSAELLVNSSITEEAVTNQLVTRIIHRHPAIFDSERRSVKRF
jgi:hypothetical protein